MPVLVDTWRCHQARASAARLVVAGMRCGALAGLALALLTGTASHAVASVDEDWVTPLLGRLAAEDAADGAAERRARARERREHHHGMNEGRLLTAGRQRTEARRGKARPERGAERHASLEAKFSVPARERPATAHQGRGGKRLGTMLASIGRDFMQWVPHEPPSITGAPIRWVASSDCLAGRLRTVLVALAASFGQIVVNSTCRSRKHNARVGGAPRSYHLTGNAVDFRVAGNARTALAFLRARKDVGGLKHYGHGVFHIDTGPRRTW